MNESKSGDSSLHDWFSKSRSSDGKPGWVQLGGKYAGKPCAKQPGQTTKPKCGSSKMKRNLDKGEEEAAFRRKNREDPNPNRKGKAKNVATEEMNLDEKCWKGYTQKGMKKKGNKVVPNCVPVGEQVKPIGVSHPLKTPEQVLQGIIDKDKSLGGGKVERYGLKKANEEVEQVDEIAPAVIAGGAALAAAPYLAKKFLKPQTDKMLDNATKNSNLPLSTGGGTADLRKAKQSAGMQVNSHEPEGDQLDENPVSDFVTGLGNIFKAKKDKKEDPNKITSSNKSERETLQQLGMSYEPEGDLVEEEGKKDACYKKVKSRYSVWPSAYASGALVKCRKVGAANWGNKKEEYEINEIHTSAHTPHEVPSKNLKKLVSKAVKRIDTDVDGDTDRNDKAKGELGEFIPGVGNKRLYSSTRTKTAQGNMKIKSVKEALEEQNRVKTTGQAGDPTTVTYPSGTTQRFVPGSTVIRDVDTKPKPKKPKFSVDKTGLEGPKPFGEETEIDEGIKMTLVKAIDKTKPAPLSKRAAIRQKLVRSEIESAAKKKRRFSGLAASEKASKADKYMSPAAKTTAKESFAIEERAEKRYCPKCEKMETKSECSYGPEYWEKNAKKQTSEAAAWTRKAGKNKEGGLNEKGRKSYERENPGSDLKAPSKKVGNPRRKSFCARMSGMKKKLTSSKTANDPNSRINKSLRAWNC